MKLSERRAKEVERLYGGIEGSQMDYHEFRRLTLASADGDDRVYPPPIQVPQYFQALIHMVILEGTITNKASHNEPFDFHITDAGRAALEGRE